MSWRSQNSLAIANLQLWGWEGVNLQLRQQGLCQQGPPPARATTSKGHHMLHRGSSIPAKADPPSTAASASTWHPQEHIARCMALLSLARLPSVCNAAPLQRCPGFLQSHQTFNLKLRGGSLTQAVTSIPDPSSTSAWSEG